MKPTYLWPMLILTVVSAFAFQSCKEAEGTGSPKSAIPRPVSVMTLSASDAFTTHVLPGIAKSARETTLSFRVSGPLTVYTAETGKAVKKGDIIARIDDRDYRVRVRQAKANLTSATATLTEATLQYVRFKALLKDGAVAKAEYDRAVAAKETAAANMKTAEAALENAKNQLDDTVLSAPYDGVINKEFAEIHQRVNTGEAIMTVIDLSEIEVMVGLPSAMLPSASTITKISCVFSALGNRAYPAVVREIGQQADPGSRTYPATLSIPGETMIRPGMTADVHINIPSPVEFTIPAAAMVPGDNGGTAVFIVNDGVVEKKAITPLQSLPQGISIQGDLSSGDQVVVAGAVYLKPGQQVRAMPAPSGTNVGNLM